MAFQQAKVRGRDFQVWHGFDVKSSLVLHNRNWFFALLIVASGLLVILVVERVVDYHQRRVANMGELAAVNSSLEAVNSSLEAVSNQLYAIATKDHLTQVMSRGFFLQCVGAAVREAHSAQRPLCFVQLDIDYFKGINDSHGHPVGDAAIQQMAELCRRAVRGTDPIGRLGGEEFAICLVDCELDSALTIAEELRKSVATTPLTVKGATVRFTCSIGVTTLTPNATPETLLSASDQALYRAKSSGRNCVRVQGQLLCESQGFA